MTTKGVNEMKDERRAKLERMPAKDTIGFLDEVQIDPTFLSFPWEEYRLYPWPVIRKRQLQSRRDATEAVRYDLAAADRPGQTNRRFPHYDWIYSLCRAQIENTKICLMDPMFRDHWEIVLAIKMEIADLEEQAEQLRTLMWDWRRRHGISETWE
jgi:hypothetical protein